MRTATLLLLALTPLMASALTSPGKPGAPVEIGYKLLGVPEVGKPLEVELRVTARAKVDEMRLDYDTSERMALGHGTPDTMQIYAQKQGVPALQRITVVPNSVGLHYLKVRVVTLTGGRRSMRGVAIPIGVGSFDPRAHLKQNGTPVVGVGGERVTILRAAEDSAH